MKWPSWGEASYTAIHHVLTNPVYAGAYAYRGKITDRRETMLMHRASAESASENTQNGVLKGPMGDVPPTGRSIEVDYTHVLRYRDGKHASFNLMFDRLMMLERLGLVPTPAPAG